jgi:hypothetical protein
MKKLFLLLFLIVIVKTTLAFSENSLLIFDTLIAAQKNPLPKNFRTTRDLSSLRDLNINGLENLNLLGSAAFTDGQLKNIIKKMKVPPQNITVVDLRQESHGFVNNLPISWYGQYDQANRGKTNAQVQTQESHLLQGLELKNHQTFYEILEKNEGNITKTFAYNLPLNRVESEESLVRRNQLNYFRLYITDHMMPQGSEVDRFIQFARHLPKNHWLYFHCHAGVGRTTTFMLMYDILRNAKKVPLPTLIERQYALGGKDLSRLPEKTSYKYQDALERKQFIEKFYQYARTNQDDFQTSWSNWLANHLHSQ